MSNEFFLEGANTTFCSSVYIPFPLGFMYIVDKEFVIWNFQILNKNDGERSRKICYVYHRVV